LNVKLLQ